MEDRDDQRLVVWGEKREQPDWDGFLQGLIAYSERQVERARLASVIQAVAKRK